MFSQVSHHDVVHTGLSWCTAILANKFQGTGKTAIYPMYLLYNQLREPLITVAFIAKTIFWVFLGKIKL